MKICPHCGCGCGDGDVFCGKCGFNFNGSETYYRTANNNYNAGSGYESPYDTGPKNNPLAIASLVLGIISVPTIFCCGLGIITAILAIIFGCFSLGAIRRSDGSQAGSGLAVAGLVIGIIAIVIIIVVIAILVITGRLADSDINGLKPGSSTVIAYIKSFI